MAGNILTPTEIWEGFKSDKDIKTELISESRVGDIIISRVYLGGRKVQGGRVKIYGIIAHNVQMAMLPAIIVFSDVKKGIDEDFAVELASKGYYVFAIDFAGKKEDGYYTIYPDSLSYANYDEAKDLLFSVPKSVKETCYYEWGAIGKNVLSFVASQPFVTRIGAIGIDDGATPLWHVASGEKNLAAAVFVKNAGWASCFGRRKFSGERDPQFSDNMLKFVAGIEPQSYAMTVKCPTLLVATTNSVKYDFDRVYDTASRISERVYKAVAYSVGVENVSARGYDDILKFFEGCLFGMENANKIFPSEPEIKCEEDGGTVTAEITAGEQGLKSVSLFVAEDVAEPSLRFYRKVDKFKMNKYGRYVFTYKPNIGAKSAYIFAETVYENGFYLNTPVLCKTFNVKDADVHKAKILFSGIKEKTFANFTPIEKETGSSIDFKGEDRIRTAVGPMGIKGVTSDIGIMTFRVNRERNKPTDDSILRFDVYTEKEGEITVEFVTDYIDSPLSYRYTFSVSGGKIWHSVMVEKNKLKTQEGRIIKGYSNLNVIRIYGTGKYLINNVLWI